MLGKFDAAKPEQAVTEAYLAADKELLSVRGGFMGMGEWRQFDRRLDRQLCRRLHRRLYRQL